MTLPHAAAALGMKWTLFYFSLAGALAVKAAEEYREELTLRPLVDGKVAAHFSFSTLLRGAFPRAPSSLATDDACMSNKTSLLFCSKRFFFALPLSSPAL